MNDRSDFLIIGGGIIGLCVARSLKRRHPDATIRLLEKETFLGYHATGRNSGVLHAGFYYTADSLKARFCRDGNLALREYIQRRGLALNPCGKLVVARNESELSRLDELLRRAERNGVQLESVTEQEARRIEPRALTFQRALWSPNTATADPLQVVHAMREDAEKDGIQICSGVRYLHRDGDSIQTTGGTFHADFLVNCAGLQADQVAADFGFSKEYRILPFKGLYLYSNEATGAFKTNIYPVPDLRNPFLGVHFTITVDGHAKIGPTAIPAFWREQYDGLDRFSLTEFAEIAWRDASLFLFAGFDFRRLAIEEIRKYSRPHLVALAGELASDVRPENYVKWGKPGIRAQLMHLKSRKLEMDFVLEGDSNSFHVLNAVSPAWTCSLPFAEYVVDELERRRQPQR